MTSLVPFPDPREHRRPAPRYPYSVDLRDRVPDGHLMTRPLTYGSDVWDLAGARQIGHRHTRTDFTRFAPEQRAWLKDWMLLRGAPQLVAEWLPDSPAALRFATVERGNWRTAAIDLSTMSRALRAVSRTDPQHPEFWRAVLPVWNRPMLAARGRRGFNRPSPEQMAVAVALLQRIYDTFAGLGLPLPFVSRPWGTRHPDEVANVAARDSVYVNKQRPHADVFGWLGVCLRAIDVCGDDVLTRLTWWRDNFQDDDRAAPTDRFEAVHPGQADPHWLPEGRDLRPHQSGLYWWSNRLVWAAYYALAAMTSMRREELDLLAPDCMGRDDDGRHTISGLLSKSRRVEALEPQTWTVTANVAHVVEFTNKLRTALGAPAQVHPKTPNRKTLFSQNLIVSTNRRGNSTRLHYPLLTSQQDGRFRTLGRALHQAGVCPSVESLGLHTHSVVRITGLEAHASQPLGDAVAVAVAKWRAFTTVGGYIGHVTKITAPAPSLVTPHRTGADLLPVIDIAATRPDDLTGRGADQLIQRVAADPTLAPGVVSEQAVIRAATKGLARLTVGPISACIGPEGGLCGNGDTANHTLCGIGCRNAIYTPYQRAHLELRRRYALLVLGPLAPFAARVADSEDTVLAGEAAMTYDQLVDVLLAEWGTTDRELVELLYPLLRQDRP